ncbi:MAG: T9SS type A sorting domain-containing protein [Bacteroidales bacterium]|nr:T9SS type A sorting domain-containing protein [Bacteroidales bacterium]
MDVQVHTNQSNVYFDGGHIRIKYDTSIFHPNIANSGFFSASFCSDFQSDSYYLYGSSNPTANTLDIMAGLDYVPVLQRVLLDTVPKPFLHLAFAVNLDSASHGVAFQTVTAPYGNPTYATSTNAQFDQYYDFDNIIHLPSDTFKFHNNHMPTILQMDSIPKIAGVGDTLIIRGLNFGDTIGKVLFKSADDGGQTHLLDLDDQYYLTWSNSLIKVIVPSIVYKGYEHNVGRPYSGGAGSGNIKIITHHGDTSSTNNVNYLRINYSVANIRGNDSIIRRTYLVRQHCDYDYQFTLHRDFENDSIKISVMDTALRLWSKLTGLTLQLERDAYGNLVFEDSDSVTGKNIIYFASNTNQGLMTTFNKYSGVRINDTLFYHRTTGSNIRIVKYPINRPWNYSLSDSVNNQYSFYQAFLHEIGHILLLGHVNDIADIMFYSTGELNYILIPDTSSWAVKGVLANIEASRNINWPANSGLYPIGVRKPTISIADNKPPYICNGTSLTLQASPSGEQFSWSTGATTPSITVNNAGLYSVFLTDGGCTLSDSIFIGNSTLQATLSATNTNCPNDASGSISAQTTGNHPPFSYLWSGNGITPANTPQINNLLPGNYHLTLTDSVGCQTQFSQSITSTIGTLHVCVPFIYDCPLNVGFQIPNTPCSDPVFAVAYGGSPPYQYNWYYYDAGSTPPTNARSLSSSSFLCNVNIPFKKSLYIHVQDSCGQTAYLEIRPGMLQNNKKSTFVSWNVEIYPNPTTGNITIQSSESKIQKVEVYDIYGKLLKTTNANSIFTEINISDLAAGIYVARIITENGIKTKKFVKE